MSVQREHREVGAGAGEPAGGRGPNLPTAFFHPAGRQILLTTPLKPRKWSTLTKNAQILPAIFAVSEQRRFHPRAAANLRPCSKSENSPQNFQTNITSSRHLHTPHALLTIHAQAAAIMTRRLSFMHPVQRICSCPHRCTGCRDSGLTALIHAPCAWIVAAHFDGSALRSWILDTVINTDANAIALCLLIVVSAV